MQEIVAEIINPSDECFIKHSDPKVLIVAAINLGNGLYGLRRADNNEVILPILRFGGGEHFISSTFGGLEEYKKFSNEHLPEIASALESVSLPKERTSLNDIKKKAEKLAESIRKSLKEQAKSSYGDESLI